MERRIYDVVPELMRTGLDVGHTVLLHWIDEDTDDEGRPFSAVIVSATEAGDSLRLTFEADFSESLVAELVECADRPQCFLHFLFRSQSATGLLREWEPSVLLDLWSPDGDAVAEHNDASGRAKIRIVAFVDSKSTRSPRLAR